MNENSASRLLAVPVLLLALTLAACSNGVEVRSNLPLIESSGDVSFTTTTTSYQGGAIVEVRLVNGSDSEVGYNICFAFLSLERYEGGGWSDTKKNLGPDEMTACTNELRIMQNGGSDIGKAYLPRDLAPGTYRLVHDAELDGERTTLATNSFTVTE